MPVSGYHPPRAAGPDPDPLGHRRVHPGEISTKLAVPARTIQQIIHKAKVRGYNPQVDFRIRKETY
ncbi:uncharacterized protein BO80DRAFT_202417 [Aspergillus ibericus CBS 121593]|uniref:Uncharacterized protein n=1 Tax=Aspergillus ibericus CBS 121593 TaxID=1448316 RepID=A0A395HBM1_9EURO|nr:hypothetical protein BO80DRAFT_202417 [Aspergillus ibericus CBS 121593]RAL04525.1 hypothetical protein BO80DRAFT_202417 [Aspergillus ibericus CBS 121593]